MEFHSGPVRVILTLLFSGIIRPRESTHFNEMWEKMVTKLEHGKKHILDLIEQSVAAYDQREELCHKIQNLNDKSQNENHSHMQEMRELQRQLDHDAKLQQFFAIKGNRRINAELEIRESNRRLVQQEQADQQLHDLQSILDQIQVTRFIFIGITQSCDRDAYIAVLPGTIKTRDFFF